MEYPYELPERVAGRWYQDSIYCYSIGCRCDKCRIGKMLESYCRCKYTVLELVKRLGPPDEETIKRLENETKKCTEFI